VRAASIKGARQITMHPGAHVGEGAQKQRLNQIIKGLNEVRNKDSMAQIVLRNNGWKRHRNRSFFEN